MIRLKKISDATTFAVLSHADQILHFIMMKYLTYHD